MFRGITSKKFLAGGFIAALLGAALTTAPLAAADEIPLDGSGAVDLTLTVEETGELTMTVDTATPVALVEGPSDGENRTFNGTLPTVTVSDTRSDVPDQGEGWSVVAQSTDFTHVDDNTAVISNAHLGWRPALVEPAEQPDEEYVIAGEEVLPEIEGGPGLTTGVDLLISGWPSENAQQISQEWKADAELELIAPADELQSGDYTATLTLSLFEY